MRGSSDAFHSSSICSSLNIFFLLTAVLLVVVSELANDLLDSSFLIAKDKFQGKVIGTKNKMFVNGVGAAEYGRPVKNITDEQIVDAKARASTELDNLLDAGFNYRNEPDGKDGHIHDDVVGGFDVIDVIFKVANEYFKGEIKIKNIKKGKLFKDVTQIKNITNDIVDSYGENPKFRFTSDVSKDNVSQPTEVVKSDSMKSLRVTNPVYPTNTEWVRGKTADDIRVMYPTFRNSDVQNDYVEDANPNYEERKANRIKLAERTKAAKRGNGTQIAGTLPTYQRLLDTFKKEGFNGTILDASSGLGLGTDLGIRMGFDMEDIEPYHDPSYQPVYSDYSRLNKQFDRVISSAVINVLPQNDADSMVVQIGEALKPNGKAYITVRSANSVDGALKGGKSIRLSETAHEYLVPGSDNYQRGYTTQEFVAYVQDVLGDGFTVEPSPKVWNAEKQKYEKWGDTSVVVTKKADASYQLRDTAITPRQILANALESTVQNDIESKYLAEYKENIDKYNELQEHLNEVRAEIKELSFAKGKRDANRLKALREDATKTANRLSVADGKLLRLQAASPLKALVEREKAKAMSKMKEEGNQKLADYKLKVEAKETKRKILKIAKDLRERMTNPSERRFIPIALVNTVVKVIDSIDQANMVETEKGFAKYIDGRVALLDIKQQYDNLKNSGMSDFETEYDEFFSDKLGELADALSGKHFRELNADEMVSTQQLQVSKKSSSVSSSRTSITRLTESAMVSQMRPLHSTIQ